MSETLSQFAPCVKGITPQLCYISRMSARVAALVFVLLACTAGVVAFFVLPGLASHRGALWFFVVVVAAAGVAAAPRARVPGVERRESAMRNAARMTGVIALLVLVPIVWSWSPSHLLLRVAAALVALAGAVGLVARAPWSRRARVAAFLGAIVVTYALVLVVIVIAFSRLPAPN